MLKLSAIDLYDGVCIAIKNFSRSFNHASLSGTSRAKKQHCPDRTVWWIHAREKNLVEAAHAPDGAFLANNACRKPFFKVLSTRALLIWIEVDRTHILHVSCSRHVHLS